MKLDRRGFLAMATATMLGCERERGSFAGKDASSSTWQAAATPTPIEGRTPIVVELFSSEGCSSCPPADTVLADLVATQPVEGALILGLELHVDYWDDLGWKDPFSSAAFTARQRRYATRRGTRGVFTPEAIVGGSASVLGSSRADVVEAIRGARAAASVRLSLTAVGAEIDVQLDRESPRAWSLVVALIEHGLASRPTRGENSGRELSHAPVVRWLRSIDDDFHGTSRRIALPGAEALSGDGQQIVVFLQARDDLSIVGAAAIALRV